MREGVIRLFHKLWKGITELLFPRRCPVCDRAVKPVGQKICLGCLGKLELLTPPWCMICGKKLLAEEELCPECREGRRHSFLQARALYQYQSVAPSIYRFKYGGRREYADFFGEEMAVYLGGFLHQIRPDCLVPIPLHKKRQKRRGYNQAALLAKALGRHTGITVCPHFLKRVKNTAPLKNQNRKERQNNLKKAFLVPENDVKLKTILIIDDIYTTGSTVDEAASALLQAGAGKVYVVTLASGEGV